MDTKMIGNKIAKARKAINLSQAQLAQRLFISPQAVGKWERGESIPDIVTMNRLAEILNVDLNYFSENFSSTDIVPDSKPGMDGIRSQEALGEGITAQHGSRDRQLLTNFSGSNLEKSDFAGVTAHNMKFNGSALRGANFTGADLTGSSFSGTDVRDTNFESANLSDCTFSVSDLSGAIFKKAILLRTIFSSSGLIGAKFTDAELIDVKFATTDLRKTIFDECAFNGVDIEHCDMRCVFLDGQIFTGVSFDKTALNEASFRGATLKNVSFRATYALTNKYYRAISTLNFDGAMIDKLTYAALKGLGANLSNVTVI